MKISLEVSMAKKPITIPINYQNLAMIGAIIMAAASIVWGASKIDSRVADIEKWIVANGDVSIKLVQTEDHQKILEANQQRIMQHLDGIDMAIARKK